jgi:hypothetical protein
MAKYRKRRTELEAMQNDGTFEGESKLVHRWLMRVWWDVPTQTLRVKNPVTVCVCRKGDWIVESIFLCQSKQ